MEGELSLNIVREPIQRKRRAKPSQPPPAPAPEEIPPKINSKFNSNKPKMTVWKALKGKPIVKDKAYMKGANNNSEWRSTRLFANNPDVPEVSHTAVKPIKEPVFSDKKFNDMDLHPFMVKTLEETLQLERVTAVQERLIPVLMSGRDALVRSQTGSGKTLAFAAPIVHMLQAVRPKLVRGDGVRALVIAPSRELAIQIHEIFLQLTKSFTWLVPGLLMGGERRKAEKARLRKGITILTCTPGRLLDHIDKTDCLSLADVKYFVLDEADRMLDLGYEQDVAKIIEKLTAVKSNRQTVLLSATLTGGVERLAGLTLTNPVSVDVVDVEPAIVPVHANDTKQDALILPGGLSHNYTVTPAKLRLVTLAAFIMDKCILQGSKVIVFLATQDMVDLHTALLTSGIELFTGGQELQLMKLHGNMPQADRTKVFLQFRQAQTAVLLCTDVAARGLDLPEVDWVVQYNGPASVSDYVHRVGRTARRGLTGSAVLFLATSETNFITLLEKARVKLSQVKMEATLNRLVAVNAEFPSMQAAATRLQIIFENIVEEEREVHDLACKAYTSWVRFYASYPRNLKECFSVKTAHLGHFAKSFALKEPPTAASRHAKSIADPNKVAKKRPHDPNRAGKNSLPKGIKKGTVRRPQISEFDSGLEPIKKKKKKIA